MRTKITADNREALRQMIKEEIATHGQNCDLNHIDVSSVDDMRGLFFNMLFNGDISKWDMGRVTCTRMMFANSEFNGDVSQWNTSAVTDMSFMFSGSPFSGDVSNWDTSKVMDMHGMFKTSRFNGDVSKWDVRQARILHGMFLESPFSGDLSSWMCDNATEANDMVVPLVLMTMTKPCIAHWLEGGQSGFWVFEGCRQHYDSMAPLALGLGLNATQAAAWMHKTWTNPELVDNAALNLPNLAL